LVLLTALSGEALGFTVLRPNIASAAARVLNEKGNFLKETVPPRR
jgi:hypothetical protein